MAVDANGNPINEPASEPSEVQKRITDLSGKVKTASEERDAAKALAEKEAAEKAAISLERDFYAGFSDLVSTNPAAKDHKDEILQKVKGGYTVEDATFAVLGKAGKLGAPAPAASPSPLGGSAGTTVTGAQVKSPNEMTRDERRAALMEAEKRGDLSMN